jgi:UDPglucose 6-dehydrogenase
MLKIGIIGNGFVGKAVDAGFTKDVEKYLVDPLLGTTIDSMYSHFLPDIIFVAVPTPMGEDGTIDATIIESVFVDLGAEEHQPIAVIKSTVTPEVLKNIKLIYPNVVFNPEFLTERNAAYDFINADMLVLGGNQEDCERVKEIYDQHSICEPCPTYYMDLQAAAMVKYTLNSFLATKVLFFNKIKDIFDATGTELHWDDFTSIVGTDQRIGKSHMKVPGPDGRKGYGGACFSKDLPALVKYADNVGIDFKQLKETIRSNQEIRNQYSELDAREIAQNINFNVV